MVDDVDVTEGEISATIICGLLLYRPGLFVIVGPRNCCGSSDDGNSGGGRVVEVVVVGAGAKEWAGRVFRDILLMV